MSGQWQISGEYAEACSCAYLCPCVTSNASAPATEGFCTFTMTYRIDEGRFGDVDLAGVAFAMIAQSKAVMAEGGWVMGVVVDEAASDAQADAIGAIVGGQAGGPLAAFGPLIAEQRGVERRAIRFEVDGVERRVTIPGLLEQAIAGVPSVSAPGECLAIDNTFHPANKRLGLATTIRNVVSAFGLRWSDTGGRRNGHFAPFVWRGAAA